MLYRGMPKKHRPSTTAPARTDERHPRNARSPTPASYAHLLEEIKARIQHAQSRAMLTVNAELIRLYWDIGRMVDERQQHEGWGAAIIPRLARELHNELPEEKGYSERNIKRMLSFYRAYRDPTAIVPHPVAQLAGLEKVPQAVAQTGGGSDSILWSIPWGHHALLMEKVQELPARRWYMEQTLANGWSRNVLSLMVKSDAHRRQGRAVTNFGQLLPAPHSDLARQTLKDPYIFDFLTLDEPFHERELETGLVRHLEKFLLELGQGFAFVGRQYRVEVDDDDFYIDLLFYHLRLRAFVVIDLKTGPFKAEYAGKLNFYCNIVNDRLRHPTDQPTIGLILCQGKNRVLAEYALSGIDKPIGVSSYELTRALPRSLRSVLPTVEEIEAELGDPPPDSPSAETTSNSRTKPQTTRKQKPARKNKSKRHPEE
jgi:predicted nuclease of restriction endonuclease-like (RecB) superfamily